METLTYKFTEDSFLYQQLYQFIKDDILTGRLSHDEKLPSKRKLSQHLNLSQTTIEIAYQQLQDEGFIYSKPKVGYFVETIETLNKAPENTISLISPKEETARPTFKIEDSHQTSFPYHLFRKYAKEAFESEMSELLDRGHPQGEDALREQIRRYLYHSRGVSCTNEQIIVGSSTEQLFTLVTRLLPGAVYQIEDPGYPLIRKVLHYEQKSYIPIEVDEEGIIVKSLHKKANVVHVTPSHQFPTGAVLSAKRRTELLKWTLKKDRYIIEDDYDSEFRYKGRPLKALQGLDSHQKVIYMSTFSKSIFPSIRVAYLVLPEPLMLKYHELAHKPNITVPRHIQYIIAQFMQSGEFERNINRTRKIYKKKLDIVVETLKPFEDYLTISGEQAGMHCVLEFKQPIAKPDGINISLISDYAEKNHKKYRQQLILGYGGIEDCSIKHEIQHLMNKIIQKKET
ncbi:PLP-dependent aminotransferase family protein [Macrococcus carouselicus]|uniref:PLP-dependent aminotransferase family protein n=1 Tax=Macrococcus carouselicus TaxID=69969 RepID=A0A9Q8FQK5_9STAP|nr:PLP-dependent aminotransferase family protein [Macrococcus carouselicus]TDM00913.1 PLP-dependent aminotransferase family protein [Macrococcus carouselicus]